MFKLRLPGHFEQTLLTGGLYALTRPITNGTHQLVTLVPSGWRYKTFKWGSARFSSIEQTASAGMYECIYGDSMYCLYLYAALCMSVLNWL